MQQFLVYHIVDEYTQLSLVIDKHVFLLVSSNIKRIVLVGKCSSIIPMTIVTNKWMRNKFPPIFTRNEPNKDDSRSNSQSSSFKTSNPQSSSKANTVRTSLLSRLAEKRKQVAASLKSKSSSKSSAATDDMYVKFK